MVGSIHRGNCPAAGGHGSPEDPHQNVIQLTSDLHELVSAIRAGEGVAGRLLSDSAAALTMDTTLINLKRGSDNLKTVTQKAKKNFSCSGVSRRGRTPGRLSSSGPQISDSRAISHSRCEHVCRFAEGEQRRR